MKTLQILGAGIALANAQVIDGKPLNFFIMDNAKTVW